MGRGQGRGYYNIEPTDVVIHSNSAKGIKSVQRTRKSIKPIRPNINVMLRKTRQVPRVILSTSEDIAQYVRDMTNFDREALRVLHLDNKNGLVGVERVSLGTLDSALVHPREVYKGAILNNASRIIVVHNHTSGDPNFSQEDLDVQHKLQKAGDLVGIRMIDFIVVSRDGHKSADVMGEM